MVTFNSYRVYKNEAGESFLDLEVTLSMHPQMMIMRFTFPATSNQIKLIPEANNKSDIDSAEGI